ncbi:MAG: hypothetical protein U5P10_07915 [Spirochaetia bacterium]|nr:hypothetical protein [Spirochaetia bacterium]
MCNTLHFEKYRQNEKNYTIYLETLDELLTDTIEDLSVIAINLATNGVWKKWNNYIDDYTSFEFTDDMLNNTGDSIVSRVMKLKGDMEDLQKYIKT